MTVVVTEK